LDQLERRYGAVMTIKIIENVFQSCLIMLEAFNKDDTIDFMAMFNFQFGLLMCTLTFAEHIGHKFAAKHPYIFRNEIVKNDTGLTEEEKEFQYKFWPLKDLALK